MRILITGGAGFIGSHLVDRLLEQKHDVFIIDNLSSGSIYNLRPELRKSLFKVNIKDTVALDSIFKRVRPEVVYHLAAQINLRKSLIDPSEDAMVNILGTINILNKCADNGVKKIVFSSSGGAIYQENNEIIKTENSIIAPTSPYGIAKWSAENYINFYKKQYNLEATILRFSNVYGPRQSSKSEAGVISIFINNTLNEEPITIFGDGEQSRDYIDVHSVVEALVLASKISGTYNVSTGKATSLNDIVRMIDKYLPLLNGIDHTKAVPGELKHNCLSSDLLQSKGWAVGSTLEDGVKNTVESFRKIN